MNSAAKVKRKPRTWILALSFSLAFATCAQAQTSASAPASTRDWLNEFPSVSEVALAAFEELKVDQGHNRLDIVSDPDMVAMQLVGSFVIMRGLIFLKFNEEKQPMAEDRAVKLKAIYAAFAEAELAIGQGWNVRRGYITRGADTGRGCAASDMACYRRWFANDILNVTARAQYRQRLLARLFPCGDRAKEFYELRQRQGLKMPHLPSPAVTGQVEPEVAGAAPAGCEPYGGDADRNGLCDPWEKAFASSRATPAASAKPTAPVPALRMTHLRNEATSAPTRGLVVSIERRAGLEGLSGCFRVLRSERASLVGATELWHGAAKIESGSDSTKPLSALVAPNMAFPADTKQPFLLVEATSGPSYGAVHCEQPLKSWESRHRKPAPAGMHGPYDDANDVLRNDPAGVLALGIMGSGSDHVETGFTLLRDRRIPDGQKGAYFSSPPVRSSAPKPVLPGLTAPQFTGRDYGVSADLAFDGSCEHPDHYALVAIIHTHPDMIDIGDDNFSIADFGILFEMLHHPKTPFPLEKMYMISARDRKVRMFTPCPKDREVEAWFDRTNEYLPRVQILGPKDVPPPPCT